jgi:2-succinyl-5-enolpyruvyl-6-hydroxy-3-cyclohexene-1-carboxylate synthase
MANSSIVRYCQLFDPIETVRYESNRGTSGIDGSTSTAIGAAIANPTKMHYFISGETSFIYDSNALWIRPFPKNLKIIVVNNSGGGIFKLIPGPAGSKQGPRYFEAKHSQKVSTIAEAFELTTKNISNKDELMNLLPEFLKDEIQVLEIHTNSEQNPIDLNYFFNALKQ